MLLQLDEQVLDELLVRPNAAEVVSLSRGSVSLNLKDLTCKKGAFFGFQKFRCEKLESIAITVRSLSRLASIQALTITLKHPSLS